MENYDVNSMIIKAKHLLFFNLLSYFPLNKRYSDKFIVCITVDGDGYFLGGIERGVPVLLKIFDKHQLNGKITFFYKRI